MLPKGSISKVYKYYFTSPLYTAEIMRALLEFFDDPDLRPGGSFEADEKSKGFFNEWFLYDFVLENGGSPLANFVARNPLELSAIKMTLYKDLLATHEYGLFEVLKVDVNNGLLLKNLQTGERIYVKEQKLTLQVKPGAIFFSRVGQVGDHHELVGADTFALAGVSEAIKGFLGDLGFKLTPKLACDIWNQRRIE